MTGRDTDGKESDMADHLTGYWQALCFTAGVAVCLHQLLPLLACRGSVLRQASIREIRNRYQPGRGDGGSFMEKSRQKCRKRLARAGFCHPHALRFYLILQLGLPFFLTTAATMAGLSAVRALAIALLAGAGVNGALQQRIGRRQQAFSTGLYRVYRFLNMQISSGIAVTDALKGLHEALHDPVIHPVLVQFTALYEMTLDFALAFSVVERHFPGKDSSLLAAQITQSLQSGIAGKGMMRLETLCFTRTFTHMQTESGKVRSRLVLVAAAGLLPAVAFILYPLLHDTLQAMQSIFG